MPCPKCKNKSCVNCRPYATIDGYMQIDPEIMQKLEEILSRLERLENHLGVPPYRPEEDLF